MAIICRNGVAWEATCTEELKAMRDSIDVLGGKWKLRIMRYLANRTHEQNHFKKIQREIDGISAKMLTKELKELELNLLISRTVQDTRPVSVAYAITPYGESVLPLTDNLVQWGLNHRERIKGDPQL